jgi:flagellar hook-basal body complex protein FliE
MMSDAITSILSQIRSYQAQATRVEPQQPSGLNSATPISERKAFSESLSDAVSRVNESQRETAQLTRSFELGDPNVDLARVMIQSQESQVGFKALVEVRNRLVQAYQDVMSMPL